MNLPLARSREAAVSLNATVAEHDARLARITRRSRDLLGLSDGMAVFAQVKGVSLVSASDVARSGHPG